MSATIQSAIRTILREDNDVSALTGNRVFYVNKDQNIKQPCIILTMESGIRGLVFGGANGYFNGTVQVSCFAPEWKDVYELVAAVRTALHAFSGTVASTIVDFIKITGDNDIPNDPAAGRQTTQTYGVSLDAEFMIKE